ncbi:MAG: glutathione S-transferase [Hyphomicrobiaceae bacterium]
MKIIEQRQAPNPRRVRIFLAEKGIPMTYEQIDLLKLDHRAPTFAGLNPMQQVPVLILDDGTALTESIAICRYFEEMQPEPVLMGQGARGKATVEMWNRRMELGLLFRVAQSVRHLHPALAPLESPQIKDWGEANRPRVAEMLELMDKEAAHRPFVAGDAFSVADITALTAIDFMKLARIERPARLTNLDRWYRDVSARPSAKA